MSRGRAAALAVAGARMAYGLALAVAPASTGSKWIGDDGGRPATGVALRALGAREIALHAGAVAAVLRGDPVRPWFLASMVGDCMDVVATAGAAAHVPDGAPLKTAAVAGGSALLSALVLSAVDR
jgi:hypothetical protein